MKSQKQALVTCFSSKSGNKSLDVQYLVDTAIVLVIAVTMLYFANIFTNVDTYITNELAIIQDLESQPSTPEIIDKLKTEYITMLEYSNSYIYNLKCLLGLCILTYTYFIKDIQELIYWNLRKVYVQVFTYQLLMNFWNSCIVSYWLIKYATIYSVDLNNVRIELQGATVQSRMINDPAFDILVVLAILISVQFARLLFSLQVNRNIGPMVKILGSMFIDVSIFLVLFVTIFLIFLAIGQLLFEELNEFTSPTDAAITLFSASLGNFDYSIFNSFSTLKMYSGYIYLTLYLLYTSIMLLNFLIAILSNTYARNNNVKNGLYLRNVLHLRQRYDYDRFYSSIIYSAPPLNVITFILTPLIIFMKSRRFNRIIMITQYIPIGIFSVLLFTFLSLFISPISIILVFFRKLKNFVKMPILGAKDMFLRFLDFIVFIPLGPFEMLFWITLDSVNFALMLFAYNIVYINDYEEIKQDQINKEMDGSLKTESSDENIFNKNSSQHSVKKVQSFKVSSKNVNPVKEGLSDNTLKLLKACLKTLRDKHMEATGKLAQNNSDYYFLPTIWVLEEMRSILLIHEQINAILFGVTYKKSEDFFETEKCIQIVNCLTEYDSNYAIIEDEEESKTEVVEQVETDNMWISKTSIKKKDNESRRNSWESRIKGFLLKSNEKWILDQFNLCKKFLNQNSIQGNYEDFLHPVYQYCYNDFKHMRILREKFINNEKFTKQKGGVSSSVCSPRSVGASTSRESLNTSALK